MRARQSPVESLVMLPQIVDPVDRLGRWRQAIAALGQELRVDGPPALDGVAAEDLVRAAQVALETGLVDDLDWIAPGAAAVALYELSSALPPGRERRDIGRRVFSRLYEGDAATFAAVATRMALGPGRPFEASTLRARIGLVFNLPIGSSVNADPLALVLVSRRELFDRLISKAATGPLPSRRLAARLFELAAREAVRQSNQGDPSPADLLVNSTVKPIFDRLLADREPLVWRHAASARGILSAVVPSLREDIDVSLDPALSPTEWRRAAVSLVACVSTDLSMAPRCERLLEGEIVAKDPGVAATLVWGLPSVIDAEPEAATELLDRLSFSARPDVAEAISALLCDVANPDFGTDAAERVRALLQNAARVDPVMQAIFEDTLRGLDRGRSFGGIHNAVRRALEAYETSGARAAHELALEAMERADATMDALETLGQHGELADLLGPMNDLDASAIEQSRLHDLLLLGRSPGDTSLAVPEMERLYDRLGNWILDREQTYVEGEFSRGEMLGRRRALLVLLHLVDLDTSTRSEGDSEAVKSRLRRTVQVLLRCLAAGPDASVHRIVCAALARGLDATAREGLVDPADLLLSVIDTISDAHSVQSMMEASTHPDVRDVLRAYGQFLALGGKEPTASAFEVQVDQLELIGRADELTDARAFVQLSRGIGTNGSHRGEALRQVVLRLGRALEAVVTARGLSDLVEPPSGEGYPLGDVEHHASSLRRLVLAARRRLLDEEQQAAGIEVVAEIPKLSALIERAVTGVPPNRAQLAMSINELVADMPTAIGASLSRVLSRIAHLPISPPTEVGVIPLQTRRAELPDWLLPRRTIGAFFVVRALGAGGVSSVFVARRIEERRAAGAELYALKVPQYDPTTARSLSEQEFMQLFREEAGALLSLPQHANLARFVTFDLAARPKPILVMELISGFGLDRLVRNRSLSLPQSFRFLDGILAGLDAMHSVGVGHLDVKPSNVILRDEATAVLVDFGLSGRHLRPGCGTLEYCAPEVLGIEPAHPPTPAAADMYAFACTAFEVITGTLLFDADDEMALMNQHLMHDGWPEKLTLLAGTPEYANLCVVLAACLRRDPTARPTARQVREALANATQWLQDEAWPLRGEAITGLTG
jgi:eukaryotic-like serine/threonine-protein kinase